jgi:hypothetical protein
MPRGKYVHSVSCERWLQASPSSVPITVAGLRMLTIMFEALGLLLLSALDYIGLNIRLINEK